MKFLLPMGSNPSLSGGGNVVKEQLCHQTAANLICSNSTGAVPDRPTVSAIAEAYRAGHFEWDTDEEDQEEAVIQNQHGLLPGSSQTEEGKVHADPRDPGKGVKQSPEMVAQGRQDC